MKDSEITSELLEQAIKIIKEDSKTCKICESIRKGNAGLCIVHKYTRLFPNHLVGIDASKQSRNGGRRDTSEHK